MAELAGLTLKLVPPGMPQGEVWCTRLDDGRIRIDHADPRVLISGELLEAIARRGAVIDGTEAMALNAQLDTAGCMPPPWRATYVGAVLKINGVNQQVIYSITEYVPSVHCYIGEWPD